MRFPICIDGRNLYKPSVMREHGFTYVSTGRRMARSGPRQQGKFRQNPHCLNRCAPLEIGRRQRTVHSRTSQPVKPKPNKGNVIPCPEF